tara:strand:+ start:3470 stop:3670 length:201 start_codon:yes stop_codon:yes gene_type:complete
MSGRWVDLQLKLELSVMDLQLKLELSVSLVVLVYRLLHRKKPSGPQNRQNDRRRWNVIRPQERATA